MWVIFVWLINRHSLKNIYISFTFNWSQIDENNNGILLIFKNYKLSNSESLRLLEHFCEYPLIKFPVWDLIVNFTEYSLFLEPLSLSILIVDYLNSFSYHFHQPKICNFIFRISFTSFFICWFPRFTLCVLTAF